MKAAITILIVAGIAAALWYFFIYKKIDGIMVAGGELDPANLPPSIIFKDKEYKANGTRGSFLVDAKAMPSAYLFGKDVENPLLGLPRLELYRKNCGGDSVFGDEKYKLYDQDEKWCLYKKIS